MQDTCFVAAILWKSQAKRLITLEGVKPDTETKEDQCVKRGGDEATCKVNLPFQLY